MSARTNRIGRGFIPALALALLFPALGQTAFAQLVPGAMAPATRGVAPALQSPVLVPAPPAPTATAPLDPNAAAPTVAVNQGWGLCQCITDRERLDFSCPGSPQACQTACGKLYSYKPDALCHAAAQQ